MRWLEAFIWWFYRTVCNVMEYVGFFGLLAFAVVLMLNVSDWILDWEDCNAEKDTGD